MKTEPRQAKPMVSVLEIAQKAKAASGRLASLSSEQRITAVKALAKALVENAQQILSANQTDMEIAEQQLVNGRISKSLIGRLRLDQAKLKELIEGIEQVANLPDQIGKSSWGMRLDDGLELYRVGCPIGVIGVIFEARPDVLPQIVALCIKTANAAILKGGAEAEHTNRFLFDLIQTTLTENGFPKDSIALLESREAVNELLEAEGLVDLIIPRGSKQLVRRIQTNTRIPVLGHADGICHVYVDEQADLDKAEKVVVDSKVQYPSACNAAETILIHERIAKQILPKLVTRLLEYKVDVRVDDRSEALLSGKPVSTATELDWSTEYCDLIVSIRIVDSANAAIEHINKYGSNHTDSIITEDKKVFDDFFARVNSAGVYLNASTRFADGFRYGFGAEVGISTGKIHPRGPVGLEGLVTYKYKLLGSGHVVADYTGPTGKAFKHEPISEKGKSTNE